MVKWECGEVTRAIGDRAWDGPSVPQLAESHHAEKRQVLTHQGIVCNFSWLFVEFLAATPWIYSSMLDSPYSGFPARTRAVISLMSISTSRAFSLHPQNRTEGHMISRPLTMNGLIRSWGRYRA